MSGRYHLFERFGVEIEYMIVDQETLDVRPIADELLRSVAGEIVSDVVSPIDGGSITWSNELVLHVIELKTTEPATRAELPLLADRFQQNVVHINHLLGPMGARLMPTAMHPWMNPDREMRVWPHDNSEIYAAFNRIFDCRGHGWSNLQSTHLNLPFANDEEFARLHAAIRLVLPILPALAASSPIKDGHATGFNDTRLEVYRTNSAKIPSITAQIIPEGVYSMADYYKYIFEPMWADIAPHDPEGVLQEEFLNARGAIARFDRGSIEIRVLDAQECPAADVDIVRSVIAVLEALVSERWTKLADQQSFATEDLRDLFLGAICHAEHAEVIDPWYLRQFGMLRDIVSMREVWQHLCKSLKLYQQTSPSPTNTLDTIIDRGSLAQRIMIDLHRDAKVTDDSSFLPIPPTPRLREVYGELCDCLNRGEMLRGT